MTRDLEPALLRIFLTCASSGSIGRAAELLARSQPTVSERLKRLEDLVGAKLFSRSTEGVTLTSAGERLLPFARRIVALSEEALAATSGNGRRIRRVGLGLLDDLTQGRFPAALASISAAHPNLILETVSLPASEMRQALREERVQIVMGDAAELGVEPVALWQEPFTWFARKGVDATARPLPVVMCSRPCRFRSGVFSTLEAAGIGWRVAFESTTLSGLQAAVSAGLGIAPLLKRFAPADLELASDEAGLPELPAMPIALVRRPGTEDDRVIDDLVQSLSELMA